MKIEDHALIGHPGTSALVGRTGSIDWRVIHFMPLRDNGAPQLVRIVEGLHGEVASVR